MRPKVYVTRQIPEESIKLLKENCDVEMHENSKQLSKKELIEKLKDKDAVLVSGTKMDEEICEAVKGKCKIFANFGVGHENIDVSAATKNGIFVTYNPNEVTADTADLTMGLILATSRRIVESDKKARENLKEWGPLIFLGYSLENKTLGLIGGGRIASAVAKRAMSFDMNIVYTSRSRKKNLDDMGAIYLSKEDLLQKSDIVSLHIPSNKETIHYIGEKEFNIMKDTSILINASRGNIVDERELVKALKNKKIYAAGLDVFEKEPYIEEELKEMENVVLTPHIGTATLETRIRMGESCARNIFNALKGTVPNNCLNPEVENFPN